MDKISVELPMSMWINVMRLLQQEIDNKRSMHYYREEDEIRHSAFLQSLQDTKDIIGDAITKATEDK